MPDSRTFVDRFRGAVCKRHERMWWQWRWPVYWDANHSDAVHTQSPYAAGFRHAGVSDHRVG